MPVACMHSARSHSLEIMLHAMLNLLVMSISEPHWRPSSNHSFLERSFFLGLLGCLIIGGIPDSIIHSNWHAKV